MNLLYISFSSYCTVPAALFASGNDLYLLSILEGISAKKYEKRHLIKLLVIVTYLKT